jgi:nucleotide-binding universal stress UspA family protein
MTKKNKDRPILVPVDFSKYSEAALLCAAELADVLGSPLIVLHVVHDPGDAPGYYSVKGRNKQLERLEDVAAGMLEEFLKKVRDEHVGLVALQDASTYLVTGLPVNRILEAADKHQARMIVMGSQGRTGLAHMMLGSKAEQIVRLSPIPVTIVKNGDQ